jgi:hypothetical protein
VEEEDGAGSSKRRRRVPRLRRLEKQGSGVGRKQWIGERGGARGRRVSPCSCAARGEGGVDGRRQPTDWLSGSSAAGSLGPPRLGTEHWATAAANKAETDYLAISLSCQFSFSLHHYIFSRRSLHSHQSFLF